MRQLKLTALFLSLALSGFAQIQPGWNEVGQLKTRDAKDIKASTWSIGGETLDRDYTDYQSWKTFLGPLGAKRLRLQGGWAKTEKIKGQYDFAWLDAVIPDAASRGVMPWVELSYGNPIYEGGGNARLGGHIPTSPEALTAWDNWVRAMVTRYKDQVPEWEIWNEPDINKEHTGTEIGKFYLRTAKIVKEVQPNARLIALGMASVTKLDFMRDFMDYLKANDGLKYIDVLTYHGYAPNPDTSYPQIEKLRELVWQYNRDADQPPIVFMQGENGAPSTAKPIGALRQFAWSELTQAKWDLRRMLGDHGRGIATNLFTMSDIHYAGTDHLQGINTKGLLETNPDKTVKRPKLAYRAAQHVFSLFDSQVERQTKNAATSDGQNQSVFTYLLNGKALVTIWQNEAKPEDTYTARLTAFTIDSALKNPVFVDLISGKVFEIPKENWKKLGRHYLFSGIPIPDYPVLVTEYSAVITR